MLDPKDWETVLQVYKGHPVSALYLAQQLTAIRQSLERGRKGIPDAVKGLNLAIDSLYSHSDFHQISHKLYRQRLNGTIKSKQEQRLRKLGVKI